MPRVKRGTKTRRRHKKLLKLAKGNVGGRRRGYRQARETVLDSDEAAESCALRRRFPSAELTALLPAGARRTLASPWPRVRRKGAPRQDEVAP